MMEEHPIIMSAPMVRAILSGEKTQTRRLLWHSPDPANLLDLASAEIPSEPPPVPTRWLGIWEKFNFRPIPDYPAYVAGRNGIVYRKKAERLEPLRPGHGDNGYLSITLYRDGQHRQFSIHRLIAEAWLGPPPTPRHEVRHIDNDRINARLENVDWATPEQNWLDRLAAGNGVHEGHHAAKLTKEKAGEIRLSPLNTSALAKQYGVSRATISSIKRGVTWADLPKKPERFVPLPPAPKLWVRETWALAQMAEDGPASPLYAADFADDERRLMKPWRPSIHMPRRLSRITLEVTAVRREPVNEITEDDAIAEGVACLRCQGRGWYLREFMGPAAPCESCQAAASKAGVVILPGQYARQNLVETFANLWDSLHPSPHEQFETNPAVAVISFRRVDA